MRRIIIGVGIGIACSVVVGSLVWQTTSNILDTIIMSVVALGLMLLLSWFIGKIEYL